MKNRNPLWRSILHTEHVMKSNIDQSKSIYPSKELQLVESHKFPNNSVGGRNHSRSRQQGARAAPYCTSTASNSCICPWRENISVPIASQSNKRHEDTSSTRYNRVAARHIKCIFRGRKGPHSAEVRCRNLLDSLIHNIMSDPERFGDEDLWKYFYGGKLTLLMQSKLRPWAEKYLTKSD